MIIFSRKTCSPCVQLKHYMTRYHPDVDVRVLDVDEDPDHLHSLLQLTNQATVPVTVIEGHPPIYGLNYKAIKDALS